MFASTRINLEPRNSLAHLPWTVVWLLREAERFEMSLPLLGRIKGKGRSMKTLRRGLVIAWMIGVVRLKARKLWRPPA